MEPSRGAHCIVMGITDIRLSGSYPVAYYAIYDRSLVVHIVFSGPRDPTSGHTFSEEKRVSSRCSGLLIFKFQRKIHMGGKKDKEWRKVISFQKEEETLDEICA